MESPTGGKGTARLGPGTTALELPLGQAWHAMQAGMAQVAHSARQKFESLERGLQDQARRFQADLGNIARRWQEEAEVSQEVISEDRVEANDCSQQDGGLPSANQLCKEGSKEVGKPSHGGECGAQRLVDKKDEEACAQEWPGRTDSETESDLGLVCVVGGSSAVSARAHREPRAASARTPTPMDRETPRTIVRPEFGVLSWFWSRPKDVAMAECRKDRYGAGPGYRCPVPGCGGRQKTFKTVKDLERHLGSKLHCPGHPYDQQWAAWEAEAKRGYYKRPEFPEEEIALRKPGHCDDEKPTWIYLPREPDYSKHDQTPESEQGSEEAEAEEATEGRHEAGERSEDEVLSEVQAHSDAGSEPSKEEEMVDEAQEGGESEAETVTSVQSVYEVDVVEDLGKESTASVPASPRVPKTPNRLRSPIPRRRGRTELAPVAVEENMVPAKEPDQVGKYLPPHKRRSEQISEATGALGAKYVPPHKRQAKTQGESRAGGSSSSKAAPYQVNNASRSIVLGERISKRIDELEVLRQSLDDKGAHDEAVLNNVADLELEIEGLKGEQRAFRRKNREGHSARQERDNEALGRRLAYVKERSRKRAASHRLAGQAERTEERLEREEEWHRRFNRPGTGRKVQVFPLAEGVLANEVQAAPLSKKARTVLLEEEETAFLELPPPTARTKQLPPSARKKTSQQKKAKHKRERRREQRLKEKKTGGPGGIGHLTSFSGHGDSSSEEYPGWTRIDFVIDSGASATTIPKELVGKVKLGESVGYHSFRLANGSLVPNEGTLVAKAWLMGNEEVAMRMAVANISQPLISVGQMVNQGNKVVLSPKVSYLETKSGGIHRIFQRNGVYVLPVWMDSAKVSKRSSPFSGQGHSCL